MVGEMYYKGLHLFWQALVLLDVCLVPQQRDADDEFGKAEGRILEQCISLCFL